MQSCFAVSTETVLPRVALIKIAATFLTFASRFKFIRGTALASPALVFPRVFLRFFVLILSRGRR